MDVFGEGGNIKKSETLSKKFNQHPYVLTYLIILSFIFLSIFSELLIIHSHFMYGAQDMAFNWQRLTELKTSIASGNWLPQFAINQNNGVGSAVMTFYPYMTLIPFVLLSFMVKSHLTFIFVMFILLTFITMLVSFYSSLSVSKKVSTSYLFAIIYGFSITHIGAYFNHFDLGVISTVVVLPLVIFGFIEFIRKNHWLEMTAGISLIIFSHVLNSIFTILLLIIWSLVNYKYFDRKKLCQLLKAIVVTICITSIFWIPAINLYLNNNIAKPFEFSLGGTSFPTLFDGALSNNINAFLNVFDIIAAVVIAILFYKRFSHTIKQIYWLSIAYIIICSPIIPWHSLQNSLSIIQFPWRLYIFPELLLDYIFAVGITKYIKSVNIKKICVVLCVIAIIILQVNSQYELVNQYKSAPDLTTKTAQASAGQIRFKLSKSNQFDNLLNVSSIKDYYINQSLKNPYNNQLFNNQGLYNVNKTLQFYHKTNYFIFNNNSGSNIQELNLPFLDYYGESYQVYMDHHLIKSHPNNSQILTINNVKQGNHTLKIIPTVTALTRASRIISIIGILLYLFFALSRLFKRIKITRRKKKIKAVE